MNLAFPKLGHTDVTLCSGPKSTLAFVKPPHTSLHILIFSDPISQNASNHTFAHKCINSTSSSSCIPKASTGDWGQFIFLILPSDPCTWFPNPGSTSTPHTLCIPHSSPWHISLIQCQGPGTTGESRAEAGGQQLPKQASASRQVESGIALILKQLINQPRKQL